MIRQYILLLLVTLTVVGVARAQTVPVQTDLDGRWSCIGTFTEDYLLEKVQRFGPAKNRGNQLMRFSYVVTTHVMYPLADEHIILRLVVEGDNITIPASAWQVEWNGETWDVDSLFLVLYDVDDDNWLTPTVVPLGKKEKILRTATANMGPGDDPVLALQGTYFGRGKGPSWQIHLFAQIPNLSREGIPWTNNGESFKITVERRKQI